MTIPSDVAEHSRWGPHLAARARLVRSRAGEVRDRADASLPAWLDDHDDVLPSELRAEIAVWRAAQGIPADERTVAGPASDDDRAASYRRRLLGAVNSRYDETD